MKQNITIDQLDELSLTEKEKLDSWSVARGYTTILTTTEGTNITLQYDSYLSIGQMIEFLEDRAEINEVYYHRTSPYWIIALTNRSIRKGKNGHWTTKHHHEFCDALWEAVKEVLKTL